MKNIAGLALLLCITACSEQEFKSEAILSTDMIAFTREGKIHVMKPDGSKVRHLGYGGNSNGVVDMSWSPDGKMIAFGMGDGKGIYIMKMDGLQVKKQVEGYSSTHPTWSPDGNSLAFTNVNFPSFCADEISTCFNITRIFVASLNGPGITSTNLLVDTVSWYQVADMYPHWSPDGKKIVFCSNRASIKYKGWNDLESDESVESNLDIYIMNPDGTEVTRLTESSFQEIQPAWSPDGKKIAFSGWGNGNNSSSLYVMNTDGSNVLQVTHNFGHSPTWSPDGTRLAFVSDHEGNNEIYVINIDGTGMRRLTNDPGEDRSPAWSPISN